jgi:hypothetical protein
VLRTLEKRRTRRADWGSIARTAQQPDSMLSEFESMELVGVFPCPWVTVIPLKIVHPVHPEHCFYGVCSKSAARLGPPKRLKIGFLNLILLNTN